MLTFYLVLQTAYLGEHLVSWLLLLVSLPLCIWVLWGVRDSNYEVEKVTRVEDVSDSAIEGMALPPGHVAGEHAHDSGVKTTPEIKEGSTTDEA